MGWIGEIVRRFEHQPWSLKRDDPCVEIASRIAPRIAPFGPGLLPVSVVLSGKCRVPVSGNVFEKKDCGEPPSFACL